jgi:hypothetical protein
MYTTRQGFIWVHGLAGSLETIKFLYALAGKAGLEEG